MVNKLVENTIRISLLIQIVTTIISADGFISSVSPEHAILKEILYIETIVQVIEGIFYSHIISGLNDIKSMTPRRYFDWLITTPIMLFSTVLFFKYSELKEANSLKEFTSKDFYEGNKENVHKIVAYNAMMLLFGYMGETGYMSKYISIPLGFVFFFLSFKLIYEEYAVKSKMGITLFKVLLGIWSSYGITAMLPDVQKNIGYNILDVFSKNFYGLFIYYKIRELN
tara:strand:+ start:28 stop:705 length:678 start_codon:yes stop_codon:yes gene_type:complete